MREHSHKNETHRKEIQAAKTWPGADTHTSWQHAFVIFQRARGDICLILEMLDRSYTQL